MRLFGLVDGTINRLDRPTFFGGLFDLQLAAVTQIQGISTYYGIALDLRTSLLSGDRRVSGIYLEEREAPADDRRSSGIQLEPRALAV